MFQADGKPYEIVSMGATVGDGSNYLIYREGDRILIRGKDIDQDGILDTLLTGDISLTKANEIYETGISEAKNKGKFEIQPPLRTFDLENATGSYSVHSFIISPDKSFNRFIVFGRVNRLDVVFVDSDADGDLDRLERGRGNVELSQRFYKMVLEEGIMEGRVERNGSRFVVRPNMVRVLAGAEPR